MVVKKVKNKKIVGFIFLIIIIIVALFFLFNKNKDKAPKDIYEVAVQINSQYQNNQIEDLRSSLKAGDVLVVQKRGHSWSKTEMTSYLILKMMLTEEEARKLIFSDERGLTKEEKMDGEQENKSRDILNTQKVITRARAYMIDFEELNFKPLDILKGQPYPDSVFDWEIVKKKPRVK